MQKIKALEEKFDELDMDQFSEGSALDQSEDDVIEMDDL